MEVTPSLEFIELTKRFGETTALDGVDLTLSGGTIACLLGRNGAGKTTTMRTIMGLEAPSAGNVLIDGVSVRSAGIHDVRRRIGYLPEEPVLYEDLTGREFLRFIGELYEVPTSALESADHMLSEMDMAEVADGRIHTYSMGMKKKVAFLAATLHDPHILVLDEPTGGLDAVSARLVKETMVSYRDQGRLVLFSTHVMELAEAWADRITVLDRGGLVFDGSLAELRARHPRCDGEPEPLEALFLRITNGA